MFYICLIAYCLVSFLDGSLRKTVVHMEAKRKVFAVCYNCAVKSYIWQDDHVLQCCEDRVHWRKKKTESFVISNYPCKILKTDNKGFKVHSCPSRRLNKMCQWAYKEEEKTSAGKKVFSTSNKQISTTNCWNMYKN